MFSWNQSYYQRFCGFCEKSIDSESIVIIQNAKIRQSNIASPIEIDDGTIRTANHSRNNSSRKKPRDTYNDNDNDGDNQSSGIERINTDTFDHNGNINININSNFASSIGGPSASSGTNINVPNYHNYTNELRQDSLHIVVGSKSPSPFGTPYRTPPESPTTRLPKQSSTRDMVQEMIAGTIPVTNVLMTRVSAGSIGSIGSVGSVMSIPSIASSSANTQ